MLGAHGTGKTSLIHILKNWNRIIEQYDCLKAENKDLAASALPLPLPPSTISFSMQLIELKVSNMPDSDDGNMDLSSKLPEKDLNKSASVKRNDQDGQQFAMIDTCASLQLVDLAFTLAPKANFILYMVDTTNESKMSCAIIQLSKLCMFLHERMRNIPSCSQTESFTTSQSTFVKCCKCCQPNLIVILGKRDHPNALPQKHLADLKHALAAFHRFPLQISIIELSLTNISSIHRIISLITP
jgi:hypothetical protein